MQTHGALMTLPPIYAAHAHQLCELLGALAVLARLGDRPIDDEDERATYTGLMHLAERAHRDAGELAANLSSLLPADE